MNALGGQASFRIAHLIKGLGRGGAEMLLPGLISQSSFHFSHTVGFFLPWKDALVPKLRDLSVDVTCFSAGGAVGMFSRISSIVRFLRQEEIDLVHAHLPLAGVVARLAGRLAGIPVVYTEHSLQERYHPLTRGMNMATWRLQSAAIAVSGEAATSVRRRVGDAVPLTVIRNGIDVTAFDPSASTRASARCNFAIAGSTPVIGTVAGFRAQKRLDLWLEAASLIMERVPDAHFIIVGDGPLKSKLKNLVASLGIGDRVHFTGLLDDVRPSLAAMDVFMMSSDFEGLPVALLEAMASGLPVVATSVGGIPEVVDHGVSGYLVPPGQPDALAESAVSLIEDQQFLCEAGAKARLTIEAHFGVERMAREIESVYSSVLHQTGGVTG